MTKDTVNPPPLKNPKAPDALETKNTNPPVTGNPNTANEMATTEKEANQAVEKPKAVAKQTIKVLHVVAKREGFRRAGFAFGSESTRLVVDDLTAEQVKQLKEERMLVVTETTEEI